MQKIALHSMNYSLNAKVSITEIIACGVIRAELEAAAKGTDVKIHFLDQGLHETPKKMFSLIQEKLECIGTSVERVVLAYGLCAGGIKGIRAKRQELVVPRCHDCIALFLGSPEAYREAFRSRPGTYYLTPGWVDAKVDPLGIINDLYAPKYGIETAIKVMKEQLKHYTHIALIDTGVGNLEYLRARAEENCALLNKKYCELRGSPNYFKKLVNGPYLEEDFIVLSPESEVVEDMFF